LHAVALHATTAEQDRMQQRMATNARPHPPEPGKPKPFPYFQSSSNPPAVWLRRARGCADVIHGSDISEYECGRAQKAPVNPATGMPIG
jgi:hypothetical protein